ncbi:hypothetical protein MATL_G00179050 [Megalops atlanticus]|uniref:Uncharacterized protein n=1 Tax=Megalops atlanticus TaxID=7932 RepID=A0A9D3PPE9_MEGAT|nr:hypothetical protein MATL_G00179050 [Megalops atlanticus]
MTKTHIKMHTTQSLPLILKYNPTHTVSIICFSFPLSRTLMQHVFPLFHTNTHTHACTTHLFSLETRDPLLCWSALSSSSGSFL